jgi:hypothetical protein
MKIEGDTVTFSTGRVVDVNRGIIGIDDELGVTAGYDNGWFYEGYTEPDDNYYLTPAERIELADYMILQWQRFKERANLATS